MTHDLGKVFLKYFCLAPAWAPSRWLGNHTWHKLWPKVIELSMPKTPVPQWEVHNFSRPSYIVTNFHLSLNSRLACSGSSLCLPAIQYREDYIRLSISNKFLLAAFPWKTMLLAPNHWCYQLPGLPLKCSLSCIPLGSFLGAFGSC